MIWNKTKEAMDRKDLERLQEDRLIKQLTRVYHNVVPYREKMQEAGIHPLDITSLKDLERLPFTYKEDLRLNYPFGLFAIAKSELVRVHASSGTTGRATVVGYTRRDIEIWKECVARVLSMAGITRDDTIQVSYGYGLFTGGLGLHYGGENLGATVIPMSTSNTKKQINMMIDLGATAIASTPSYLQHIIESLEEEGRLDGIKLRVAICGGEPWTDDMRRAIEEKTGIACYDIYGLSEIMGPGVAAECPYHQGLHIHEDHFYPEIIDPDTGEVLGEGETGELVITTLTKEALPLIRYRTGDLTSLTKAPCQCGRTSLRISKFLGRSDDMLIIKGVNVFPSQVETAIMEVIDSPHYLIEVDRKGTTDSFDISVEVPSQYFSDKIADIERLRKAIGKSVQNIVGLHANIRLVEPRALERTTGKATRVIDKRKLGD